MLVFGRLEPRKFQIMKNQKLAKDDATGVLYIPGVCIGAFLSLHAFRAIYTQRGYLFARYFSLATEGYKRQRVKVQIPTFFVCGCRITDW